MRKRIAWEKEDFNLPSFHYYRIMPKPGRVYCLYGDMKPERFRVLLKFAMDLGYEQNVGLYNLIPGYEEYWKWRYNEEGGYFNYACHLRLTECADLLAEKSPEEVCDWLLLNIESEIVDAGMRVIVVDTVHFCKGKILSRFMKSINRLARKYRVIIFLGADVRQKLDYDSIYFVKPAEYKHLYLCVDYFLGLMKHPTSSDILLVKIWKGRWDEPKPAYKGKGWRSDDKNDDVKTLYYSSGKPWTVDYYGSNSLPSILRLCVRHHIYWQKFR